MYGHHLCNRLQIYSRSESGLWNCKREDAFYRDLRHAFCEVIHSCIYICHEFVVQLRSDRNERLLLTSCTMNTVLLAAVYDLLRFKLTSDQKPRITIFKPFLTRNWKWTSLFALSLSSWFSCMKWVSSEKKTEAPLFLPRQPNGLSDVFNAIFIRITLFCLLLFRKKKSLVWKFHGFRNFPEGIVGHFMFQGMRSQNITYTFRRYHSPPSFSTVNCPNLAFYNLCCRLCVLKKVNSQFSFYFGMSILKW